MTYRTSNGEQLVRGQRHTLLAEGGTSFSGVSQGVAVEQGVLHAMFVDVTGDLPTTGKKRYGRIRLDRLTTPRPRMWFE